MTFSLDRDVDDSRVQTVGKYSKNIDFPDAPITGFRNYIQLATNLFCGTTRIHEFLREILDKVVTYYDAMIASPRNWQKYIEGTNGCKTASCENMTMSRPITLLVRQFPALATTG